LRRNCAIHRDKGNGTVVDYYIFPEYEIHYNEVAPGAVQEWHHHDLIEETLFIVSGELEARWHEHDKTLTERITSGDIVRVGRSVHTFANTGESTARFVVFRLVLDGKDRRDLIKNDKVVDSEPVG
jgi:quercetin dioxygenase-like cupin family protein